MKLIIKIDVEVDLYPEAIEQFKEDEENIRKQFEKKNFESAIRELFEHEIGNDGKLTVNNAEAQIVE